MGGNPTTAYSPTDLEDAATQLQTMGNKVLDDLTNLITTANANMDQWQGSVAKQAFLAHQKEWQDAVTEMRNILTERAVPAVRNSLENYHQTENTNKQLWMR